MVKKKTVEVSNLPAIGIITKQNNSDEFSKYTYLPTFATLMLISLNFQTFQSTLLG